MLRASDMSTCSGVEACPAGLAGELYILGPDRIMLLSAIAIAIVPVLQPHVNGKVDAYQGHSLEHLDYRESESLYSMDRWSRRPVEMAIHDRAIELLALVYL